MQTTPVPSYKFHLIVALSTFVIIYIYIPYVSYLIEKKVKDDPHIQSQAQKIERSNGENMSPFHQSMEPRRTISEMVTEEAILKAFESIKNDTTFAVEGCHYVLLREYRRSELFRYLTENFVADEPLCNCLSSTWSDAWEYVFESQLKQNLSFALISDSTEEIIGAMVTHISNKTFRSAWSNFQDEKVAKILKLISRLEDKCDPLEHYQVDETINFFSLSVHKGYRRIGIGTKLMKCALAFVKELGCGPIVIDGDGTANYSKRICEKLGFDILSEVIYEEYTENDEIVFKDMDKEKSARHYAKLVC